MGQREKLLERLRNNPNDVRFEELDKLLKWCGFERRKSTGSHQVYKRKGCPSISIPYHRPVRSVYVRKVLALIEQYVDEEEAYSE